MKYDQNLEPTVLKNALAKLGCPQRTFAACMGVSEAMLALFLGGERGFSYKAQMKGFSVLSFMRALADEATAPVDFRQTDSIVALFDSYERRELEENIIKLATESQ